MLCKGGGGARWEVVGGPGAVAELTWNTVARMVCKAWAEASAEDGSDVPGRDRAVEVGCDVDVQPGRLYPFDEDPDDVGVEDPDD